MTRNYLAHWGLSDAWEEAKVLRDEGGQFASKASKAASAAADAAKEAGFALGQLAKETPDAVAKTVGNIGDSDFMKLAEKSVSSSKSTVASFLDDLFGKSEYEKSVDDITEEYIDKPREELEKYGNDDPASMARESALDDAAFDANQKAADNVRRYKQMAHSDFVHGMLGPNDLLHWGLSDAWEEAKVLRDEGGQFASKASKAASAAADAAKEAGFSLGQLAKEAPDAVSRAANNIGDSDFMDLAKKSVSSAENTTVSFLKELFPTTTTTKTSYDDDPARDSPAPTKSDAILADYKAKQNQLDYQMDQLEHSGIAGSTDWVGMVVNQGKELKHYGVIGMKWGKRRSSAELKAAAAKRGDQVEAVKPGAKKGGDSDKGKPKSLAKASASASALVDKYDDMGAYSQAQKNVKAPREESSTDRYARLAQQSRKKGANSLSDDDIKFFTARTEALKKVSEATKRDPGWLGKTSEAVLQNASKKGMQTIADGLVGKYIADRLLDATGAGPKAKAASEAAAAAAKAAAVAKASGK